ncbi:MAG TPA: hypothetical protein VF132_11750 [Rudaea sp.]
MKIVSFAKSGGLFSMVSDADIRLLQKGKPVWNPLWIRTRVDGRVMQRAFFVAQRRRGEMALAKSPPYNAFLNTLRDAHDGYAAHFN